MRLKDESELLDPVFRKRIIEEIEGTENKARKDEYFKRYECYKDKTILYVVRQLLKQFDGETVIEMSYALSNLNITRKIIDKLARVYKYGVTRTSDNEADTKKIQEITKILQVDKSLKKTNRFYKLCRNVLLYVVPGKENFREDSKKTIRVMPVLPYLYDVVEQFDDREKAGCIILSDYVPQNLSGADYTLNPARANRSQGIQVKAGTGIRGLSDGTDSIIADSPVDQQNLYDKNNAKQYVFWSDSYHFTCNAKGEIISGPETENPITEMPFVNYAEDQDGAFWAQGGDDLADGAILSNAVLTNIVHIGVTQGYGQLVMTGKNIPRSIKVGPNKAVVLEYDKDNDPVPTFDFKNASPPLDQLMSSLEMFVALLLTTNNLTTSGVSSSLDSAQSFPSGIAMIIDKAESMEDVEDQRQIFQDNEPLLWDKIAKWMNVLSASGELSDDLKPHVLPLDPVVNVKFGTPVVIESEKERVETLKLKKELGVMSQIDILRSEYPDLSDEELLTKSEEIMEEKQRALQSVIGENQQLGNVSDGGSEPGDGAEVGPDEDQERDRGISPGANP